jgi:hypothetical protein
MVSVLLAALLAAAPSAGTAASSQDDAALDLRCFQLMADLAEDEDPRIRDTSRIAAQYFLGRIDAADPSVDVGALPALERGGEDELLGRCSAAMQAGGRDYRAIGEALAPRGRPAA